MMGRVRESLEARLGPVDPNGNLGSICAAVEEQLEENRAAIARIEKSIELVIKAKICHIPTERGCLLWIGYITRSGYGVLAIGKRTEQKGRAHVVSWMLQQGPVPSGLCVLHRCDVRACVNPDHLFLGTRTDNVHDMIQKGRNTSGKRSEKRKLTDRQAEEIRQSDLPTREIARHFGLAPKTIRFIRLGLTYKQAALTGIEDHGHR
jgi:hypothetical protein